MMMMMAICEQVAGSYSMLYLAFFFVKAHHAYTYTYHVFLCITFLFLSFFSTVKTDNVLYISWIPCIFVVYPLTN